MVGGVERRKEGERQSGRMKRQDVEERRAFGGCTFSVSLMPNYFSSSW